MDYSITEMRVEYADPGKQKCEFFGTCVSV